MRKKITAVLAVIMAASMIFSGCGRKTAGESTAAAATAATQEIAQTAEPETLPEAITEESVNVFMKGIEDRYVLAKAQNVDYLHEAEYAEKIVESVAVDESGVDVEQPGTYTVRYIVTVNRTNYEKAKAYMQQHSELFAPVTNGALLDTTASETAADSKAEDNQKAGDTEERENTVSEADEVGEQETDAETPEDENADPESVDAADTAQASKTEEEEDVIVLIPDIPESVFEKEDGETAPDETVEIVIEKVVQIVTDEEAADLIGQGEEVWTDNSESVKIEELNVPETEKTEEPEKTETKPAADSSSKREDRDNGGSDSGNNSSSVDEDRHVHNWVEKTKTVHHDAKGHTERVQTGSNTVVDKEAWDEPVYEYVLECNTCGLRLKDTDEMGDHVALEHDGGSWANDYVQTDTIHHPAKTHEEPIYEDRWVEDSAAWDEEVVTGYYCTECGATK